MGDRTSLAPPRGPCGPCGAAGVVMGAWTQDPGGLDQVLLLLAASRAPGLMPRRPCAQVSRL